MYFNGKDSAKRYALYRPNIHPKVIQIIKSNIKSEKPIRYALDVGCGTGQSAIALKALAEKVIAIDISPDMISQAPRSEQVEYICAAAEAIPLRNAIFHLISVGLSLHWFERGKFMTEAVRLIKPRGLLVIYDNFFSGVMRENDEFQKWFRGTFMRKFPTPPRDCRPLEDKKLRRYGFGLEKEVDYEENITYNLDQLVGYVTTMTNTVAALKKGIVELDVVLDWLESSIRPFFIGQDKCTILHRGWIKFLKKLDN